MKYKDDYSKWRRKPLTKDKMSIKKFRKYLYDAGSISEVGDILEKFLCQFSKLQLIWIETEITHKLKEKYNLEI